MPFVVCATTGNRTVYYFAQSDKIERRQHCCVYAAGARRISDTVSGLGSAGNINLPYLAATTTTIQSARLSNNHSYS